MITRINTSCYTSNRREQEYQKQLRDQIEEKKRKKDEEKRGDDKTKQKEMREYLTGHYKGEIPERLKSILVVDGDNSDGDIDHQQHQHQQQKPKQQQQQQMNKGKNMNVNARGTLQSQMIHNDEVRETRNGDDKYYRGDSRTGDSRSDRQARKGWQDGDTDNHQAQYSGGSGRNDENNIRSRSSQDKRGGERGGVSSNDHRTGVDDDPESPDNRVARQGYNNRNDNKSDKSDNGSGNNRNHQFQDKNGRWISQVEYGELTSLCDRLMTQQDQLQVELQHQAELIKVIHSTTFVITLHYITLYFIE